jgi:DNA-binding CsgD family transcriptional regulator
MPNQTLLSELLGDIYEASYRPEHWPMVIEKICHLTHARSGALFIQDKSLHEANAFYPHGGSEELVTKYVRYSHLDPAFAIMCTVPPGVALNIQNTKQHELEPADYYQEVRVEHDCGYIAGANVLVSEEQLVGLALHRSFSASAFDDATLQLVGELIPHLQRALRIHREFIRLRVEKSALTAGFGSLLMGLVLLDHLGAPVYINPVAQSILDSHPAIALLNDNIVPTRREDAAQLRRLVHSCLNHAIDPQTKRGGVMGLHHDEARHPLAVMVKEVATSDLANLIDGVPVYAALYLSDPDRPMPISADAIATLYDLTRTESQVAIALANGMSVEDIARTHSRSINTLRTQLRSLFSKTHTSSQTELVRLLLSGMVC